MPRTSCLASASLARRKRCCASRSRWEIAERDRNKLGQPRIVQSSSPPNRFRAEMPVPSLRSVGLSRGQMKRAKNKSKRTARELMERISCSRASCAPCVARRTGRQQPHGSTMLTLDVNRARAIQAIQSEIKNPGSAASSLDLLGDLREVLSERGILTPSAGLECRAAFIAWQPFWKHTSLSRL